MAIKFKITPGRIAEACSITEYLLINNGHRETVIRVLPRFVLDDEGKYIVTVNVDSDGDITSYDGLAQSFSRMSNVTPKRLDKLAGEFAEAVKDIVNPPNAGA